jgi:uncharacterized protein YwqG
MFSKLFGPRKPKAPPRDIEPLVGGLARRAAHIFRTDVPTRSQVGGSPKASSDLSWPRIAGRPLGFLAQIDLQELAARHTVNWLPSSGALLFFYDMKEQPWGFDPKHRGGWAIQYLSNVVTTSSPVPSDLPKEYVLPEASVAFSSVNTYPSAIEGLASLQLTDEELDRYCEFQEAQFSGKPQHQIDGYANPIQGEMELECQLVSNGLYCGDPSGYKDPRAKTLGQTADEWRLLLQLDSDDDLDVMWGDCGRLYFWIREDDARSRRFDLAWVILQCA